ncbi:hypothetical protein BVX93_01560 [bacterium B13(2017)]|nr:hypothetical protein BVX93_01560 [bacterium B13(2017)]
MNFNFYEWYPFLHPFIIIFICFLLYYIILNLVKKLLPKHLLDLGLVSSSLTHMKSPIAFILPALVLKITLPTLKLSEHLMPTIASILNIWFISSIGFICSRIIDVARDYIIKEYDVKAKDNLEARKMHTQVRVIRRILKIIVFILALSCILITFDKVKQLGVSILASAGVVGIILGFAAQKSIATLFAGLQIAITQPIRLDDVVIVENEWGWIEEITLTYVVVKIWDLRRLVVPITYFIEKPFQNWTRISADLLGTVFIYTDYRIPIQEVRNELENILKNSNLWDKKAWCLQVTDSKENTLELRALMSSKDSPIGWDLRCLVREKLITFIQEKYPECLPKTRIELNKNGNSN